MSVTLTKDKPKPQTIGAIVKLKATPTDEIEVNEDQYELKNNDNDWQIIQAFSGNQYLDFDAIHYEGLNVIRVKASRTDSIDKPVKDHKIIRVIPEINNST